MNIGLIGAGHIGATAARNFLNAGHTVALSNSRGPDTRQDLIDDLGSLREGGRPMEPGRPSYNETLTRSTTRRSHVRRRSPS